MRPLLLACLIASSGCGTLRGLSDRLIYRPPPLAGPRASPPPGVEEWTLEVQGGRVFAWYLPAEGGTPAAPGPAVLYAHGGAETVRSALEGLAGYRAMGLALLLPEYRGYGGAAGRPSEEAIEADLEAFYDRLVDRPEVDPRRVVFHGRDLGGGAVGVLSTRRRCAALVLESTWTDVPDLASRSLIPAALVRDRYDTRAALLGASTPTLILHGVDDVRIPFAHAVELARVAWDGRLVAFRAGHDDLPRGAAYWAAVRALLAGAGVVEEEGATGRPAGGAGGPPPPSSPAPPA